MMMPSVFNRCSCAVLVLSFSNLGSCLFEADAKSWVSEAGEGHWLSGKGNRGVEGTREDVRAKIQEALQ